MILLYMDPNADIWEIDIVYREKKWRPILRRREGRRWIKLDPLKSGLDFFNLGLL